VVERREKEKVRLANEAAKAEAKWLQTEFPLRYAITLVKAKTYREGWATEIDECIKSGVFTRTMSVRDLWQTDNSLTIVLCQVTPPGGRSQQRMVRCTVAFQHLLWEYSSNRGAPDAPDMLLKLLEACVPRASKIFVKSNSPLRILCQNDYIMEKAFVYATILLSKWLGGIKFPIGIFDWPPSSNKSSVSKPIDQIVHSVH
jgi:hypothetical protein